MFACHRVVSALPDGAALALVAGELLASLQGPASRRAACLGGRGPAERAEGIGQLRQVGTGQRSPQQAVELAVEDGGGDGQEFLALEGQSDLTVTGSSYAGKAHADPNISAQAIRARAADYLAGTDPADPLVSPIFADLSGLPPLLIQAGSHEVLLDDATRLAVKAAADDVAVILGVTPGVPHVFQAFAALLDEGDAALNRAARFVKDNTVQKAGTLS